MLQLVWGATAMGCLTAAVFFLRFWRQKRERLFLMFSLAFFALASNWITLATTFPAVESRHLAYLLRLVAFVLILVGIIDKNRKG